MDKPLYCPFCEKYTAATNYLNTGIGHLHVVRCDYCGARGRAFQNKIDAYNQWVKIDKKIQQRGELLTICKIIYDLTQQPVFDDVQQAEQWAAVRENAWAGMQLAKGSE